MWRDGRWSLSTFFSAVGWLLAPPVASHPAGFCFINMAESFLPRTIIITYLFLWICVCSPYRLHPSWGGGWAMSLTWSFPPLQEHHPRQRLGGERREGDRAVVPAGGAGGLQELCPQLDL